MTAPGAAPALPVTGTPVLEARSLVKHFPVHRRGRRTQRGAVVHAVDDVSIAVPEASITAVVGESGCGKSTLTQMLARLIRPTSGELLLDGSPAARRGRARVRRAGADGAAGPVLVAQPVHTVRYHLARPLQIHGPGPDGGSLDDEITSLLERVSLSPQNRRQVPARAVRRAAAAGRHRPGAGRPAPGAAGRRAGVHARRLDPARRAEPARGPAGTRAARDRVRHPRHRLGALPGRHDRGHVRGPDHRAGPGRHRDRSARRTPTRSSCWRPHRIRTGHRRPRCGAAARRPAW